MAVADHLYCISTAFSSTSVHSHTVPSPVHHRSSTAHPTKTPIHSFFDLSLSPPSPTAASPIHHLHITLHRSPPPSSSLSTTIKPQLFVFAASQPQPQRIALASSSSLVWRWRRKVVREGWCGVAEKRWSAMEGGRREGVDGCDFFLMCVGPTCSDYVEK